MKLTPVIAFLCLLFSASGQNSYYFAEPLPAKTSKVETVSERQFGSYKSKDGTVTYVFDATGLTLISTTISSISRETVRESAKYEVRNGYIFGVEIGDSVPCYLEDEYYYFGVRNSDVSVGIGSKNVLCKTSDPNVYVLNVYENGKYIPQLLQFKGNKLTVSHFDYSGESNDEFAFVESQEAVQMDNLRIVILKPGATEFTQIQNQAFVERLSLKK